MKSIVFIGTHKSGSSYEAIAAAKSMGFYTVLLTNVDTHLEKRSDFLCVDLMKFCFLDDVNSIRHKINNLLKSDLEICAIVSFIEEYCYTAGLISKEFGLNYHTLEAVRIMLDKIETRKAIHDTPYSPFFRIISSNDNFTIQELKKKFPLVLKEPLSSGSKGVIKVNTYPEYKNELAGIRLRYPNEPVLLEECLEGTQFLVETLTIDGNVNIVAVIEQEITYARRFIITGYKVITDCKNAFFHSLITAAEDIIKKIGLQSGPCHLEIRYIAGQWKLIEANPRISGGAMNLLIETAYGINLVKETLKITLGQTPDLEYKYKNETYAHYVIIKREGILIRVTGRNKALKCEGVRHVYIKPRKGQLLIPPLSMGNRYAYVIATGNTADEAMTNAKFAAKQIQFLLKDIDAETLNLLTPQQKAILNELNGNKPKIPENMLLSNIAHM